MSAPGEADIGTLIERRPGVYGGRPVLRGTRFPILQIAALVRDGWDAERIHQEYLADLDISLVYTGIAYYLANRTAVDAELAAEQAAYNRDAARHRSEHPKVISRSGS